MRRVLATLTCLAAVAAPARGAEFVPGMAAYGVWDANVFHASENEESAFSTLSGPVLELREKQGSLLYDVKYTLNYEFYPTLSGLNDFQHFLDATGSYRFPNGQTMLSVRNYFTRASTAVQIFNSQLPSTVGLLQFNPNSQKLGREDFLYNDAGATLTHSLTPLWQLQFSFDYTFSDFPKNKQLAVDQFNSTVMVGSAQITRQISPRLTAGFGSSVTRQDFEQNGVSGRGATFYQAFGIANFQISPTLSLQGSVGPAINEPDSLNTPTQQLQTAFLPTINRELVNVNTCPFQGSFRIFDASRCQTFPGTERLAQQNNFRTAVSFVGANEVSPPQSSLTYYGRLSLVKKWETLTAVFSYDRSASTASGLGTSTNIDALGGSLTWQPTAMWSATLNSTFSRQTAASKTQQPLLVISGPTPICLGTVDASGNCNPPGAVVLTNAAHAAGVTSRLVKSGLEFTTYRVDLNVSRKINKRLTVIGIGSWWRQENTGSEFTQSSQAQDFRFQLGFTYTFDSIPLWTKDF